MVDFPRPEYPRPQFAREQWLNLNGSWKFQYDVEGKGEEYLWHLTGQLNREILVPFVHQSVLSGIGDTAQVDNVWYSRCFTIPESWCEQRIMLNFGAVDYEATVWVNGQLAGTHKGGFTSFAFDITDICRFDEENLLVVRAYDPISPVIPSGKQSDRESYGCYYTRSTGIWQTVWLEPIAKTSICRPHIQASLDESMVHIKAPVDGYYDNAWLQTNILSNGELVCSYESRVEDGYAQFDILITDPIAWEPGNPHLYDVEFQLFNNKIVVDSAKSYFGMRDVRTSGSRLLLNGEPFISRGILDQGMWPDGLYTAPSDDELRLDIQRAIDLGFNSARLHQKVFEERSLYWADVLGYPVWAEFPDWGCNLSIPETRENFKHEWLEAVSRDMNHPSIIVWTPFNERYADSYYKDKNQHSFVRDIVKATKELDPTRPVSSSSGFGHIAETDIADPHDYDHCGKTLRKRYTRGTWEESLPLANHGYSTFALGEYYRGQPVIISEMGGMWWGKCDPSINNEWGYGKCPGSLEDFIEKYREVITSILDCERLCGFVYTQLTDVEQEANGLYYADRSPKFDASVIRTINRYGLLIEQTVNEIKVTEKKSDKS
ncbi:MAG: glycoside hydrolase family 2 protein [Armatimonadota bacterium]